MFKKILALSFVLITAVSYGQDNVRKAQKILNQVSRSYKNLKTLKATFELHITEPGSKKPSIEKGTLYLKDDNFKVEMATVDIICNGKTQWYYMKDVNEVQITNFNPDEREITPNNIFTMYDKGFKYVWVEEKNENGRMVDIIELAPKDNVERKEYTKIKLSIDRVAKQILSSEIFFRSGRKMKYTITQQVRNINLAANFFDFDPSTKAGIQVVDLR